MSDDELTATNATGPSPVSSFRTHAYHLAWLMTYALYACIVLMWMVDHYENHFFGDLGSCLFLGAGLFSILARRFTPIMRALVGILLLGMSLCA